VIYPKVGYTGGQSHQGLVFKFFGERTKGDGSKESIDDLLQAIARDSRGSDRNVVISCEALEYRDVGAFVRGVLPYVGNGSIDVEILFACREHFARAASLHNHRVSKRALNEKRTPDEYLGSVSARLCYAPLVKRLRDTGFNITAMNYHPSDGWVKRFMMHIGFPEDQIPEIPRELVSNSPKLMIVNLALKRLVATRWDRARYIKPFRAMHGSRSPSRFVFGRDAAVAADRLFSADRQFLKEEFGIEITPPDLTSEANALFITSDDLSDIAAAAAGLGAKGEAIVDFARQYVR